MRIQFLLVVFLFAAMTAVHAQIPEESPFPVTFQVTGADGNISTYGYVSTTDFGDTLRETVSAEMAWAFDDGMYDGDGDGAPDPDYADSLACSWGTVGDVTGKIALIRRGACFFSQKIYNVQEAGAIGAIICNTADRDPVGGMSGADSAAVAVIPAIFLEFQDCAQIDARIQSGETLTATFKVSFAFDPFGPTAYQTPQSQVTPLDFLEFTVFNPSETDPAFDVSATVSVTDPGGNVTTYEATADTIAPVSPFTFTFDEYVPSDIGQYTIAYANSLNADILSRTFEVTEFTYAHDNGNIVMDLSGTIEPSDEGFVEDGLTYDAGVFYRTGENGGTATFASFMIGNPDELFTGDEDADLFTIILYDTDADDDGTVDLGNNDTDYSSLTAAGFATYVITEDHQPFDLITVPFDDPITLKPNHQYLLMVQYNGTNAGLGIPPKYAYAGNETFIYELADGPVAGGDIVFTDQLYSGGWAGADYNYVIRMHMEGFVSNIEDMEPLAATAVKLFPNPTSADVVNMDFNLEEASEVQIGITDFAGKLVRTYSLSNVLNNVEPIGIKGLAAGTYFVSIVAESGYRVEKLVVID